MALSQGPAGAKESARACGSRHFRVTERAPPCTGDGRGERRRGDKREGWIEIGVKGGGPRERLGPSSAAGFHQQQECHKEGRKRQEPQRRRDSKYQRAREDAKAGGVVRSRRPPPPPRIRLSSEDDVDHGGLWRSAASPTFDGAAAMDESKCRDKRPLKDREDVKRRKGKRRCEGQAKQGETRSSRRHGDSLPRQRWHNKKNGLGERGVLMGKSRLFLTRPSSADAAAQGPSTRGTTDRRQREVRWGDGEVWLLPLPPRQKRNPGNTKRAVRRPDNARARRLVASGSEALTAFPYKPWLRGARVWAPSAWKEWAPPCIRLIGPRARFRAREPLEQENS
ncbi:hypothetical protein MRX96_014901 [Rhipicephalus microplus]